MKGSVHTRIVEGGVNDHTYYIVLWIIAVSANFCGKSEKALRINLKFHDNNPVRYNANDDVIDTCSYSTFFRH